MLQNQLFAQEINTLYFIENSPLQHIQNPAFQPQNDFYISLPILGFASFDVGNNSLKFNDLYNNPTDLNINVLNQLSGLNLINNILKQNTVLHIGFQTNLLSFGFKKSTSFWNFTISEKIAGTINLPKDILDLMLFNNPESLTSTFSFAPLQSDLTLYTETALGYSNELNEKWSIGGKFKFLLGHMNMSNSNQNFDIQPGLPTWQINATGSVNIANLIQSDIGNNYQTVSNYLIENFNQIFKPVGFGVGIDLGLVYRLNQNVDLSASILDLGFIRWRSDVVNYNYSLSYDGILNYNNGSYSNPGDTFNQLVNNNTELVDSLSTVLNRTETSNKTNNSYFSSTSTKLNLGLEYDFFEHMLGLGLLSKTQLYKNIIVEDATLALNLRPYNWLNGTLSYSLLNGTFSTFGVGVSLNVGFVNLFMATDYVSTQKLQFNPSDYSSVFPELDISIPYNSREFNFSMGVNLVFDYHNEKNENKSSNIWFGDIHKNKSFSPQKHNTSKRGLKSFFENLSKPKKGLHPTKSKNDCRCEQ